MANDSATGGYLVQTDGPIYGDALDDFFGDLFAELTELDRDEFIRPLFQINPPPIPEADINWLAFGVRGGPRLTVHLGALRFVVDCLEVRRTAGLTEIDDSLRFGGMM